MRKSRRRAGLRVIMDAMTVRHLSAKKLSFGMRNSITLQTICRLIFTAKMARRGFLSGPFWLSHYLQRWAKDIVKLFSDAREHTAFQVHIDLVNHFRVGMTYQLHGNLLGHTSLRQHADVFVTQLMAAYIGYPVALYIGISMDDIEDAQVQ